MSGCKNDVEDLSVGDKFTKESQRSVGIPFVAQLCTEPLSAIDACTGFVLTAYLLPTTKGHPIDAINCSTTMAIRSLATLMLSAGAVLASNDTLVSVSCPDDVKTFEAGTIMVFEGRSELLSPDELVAFHPVFEDVYNTLAETSCDSFFRRIVNLTMVGMKVIGSSDDSTNVMNMSSSVNRGGRGRQLQVNSTNSTSEASGFEVTYEVRGTCRGCTLTSAGSFDIYDETFRRMLRQRPATDSWRDLQEKDCQCVEMDYWRDGSPI